MSVAGNAPRIFSTVKYTTQEMKNMTNKVRWIACYVTVNIVLKYANGCMFWTWHIH